VQPTPLVDDFGDRVDVGTAPARIVSLNPTTTELLFALGAGDRLVGRTHWDVYPAAARVVPDLGPGIRPNVEAVLAARPQLVVLYASADNRPAAASLRAAGVRVVALRVDRFDDFARAARTLGDAIGERPRADTIVDSVARTLDRVREVTASAPRPRVLWPLLADPLYVIGGGSFMSDLIEVAGGRNVFADLAQPSPQVGREEVLRRDADGVIAAPTAAARLRADPAWRGLTAVRAGRVFVEDTALVERPSVRLGEAALSVALLLHPELRGRLLAAVARR
jgi:ABC-type Fe3+-hydroxamate transport system substrate-binding protein